VRPLIGITCYARGGHRESFYVPTEYVDAIRLAGGAPMPEVRAEATEALTQISRGGMQAGTDYAAGQLMNADIKRFLDRPMEPIKTPTTYDAPPGAPIGDEPMDWLASPPWSLRPSIADWRLQIED